MLRAYLAELESELARRLPPEDVQARLVEAEAHLRDGTEGRVELGLTPEEAEREAIEAFGLSRRVARAEPSPSAAPRLRLLAAGYGLGVLLFLILFPLVQDTRWGAEATFAIWIGLGFAFAIQSFRARRPTPIPVALTGLVGTLAVWLASGTWLNLDPYGVVPWNGIGRVAQDSRQEITRRRAARAAFEGDLRTLRAPQGIEAFRKSSEYRAPIQRVGWGPFDRLEYGFYGDPNVARRAWDAAARGAWPTFDTSRPEAVLAAIPLAQADPVGNLRRSAPALLPPSLGVAAFAVFLDLGAAGLGAAWALRRRRGPTVA